MEKRLYRSKKNRVILGVCGGIGEYLNIDPTIIRLIFIFFLIAFNFSLVVVYFLSALIIPEEPDISEKNEHDDITPSGPIQHL
uniref:PspC domain-containing protein n=1 Tax=Dictyoglomus thermophilum TaxID=14 RepID=A0A7C3RK54_DICTH